MTIKTIPITKARNEFFDLAMQTYYNDVAFAIEKNGITVGILVPPKMLTKAEETQNKEREKQLKLIERIRKHRESMKMGSDSVKILRQLRRGRYYD